MRREAQPKQISVCILLDPGPQPHCPHSVLAFGKTYTHNCVYCFVTGSPTRAACDLFLCFILLLRARYVPNVAKCCVVNIDDTPTSLPGRILNGHISATDYPIQFRFGSRVGAVATGVYRYIYPPKSVYLKFYYVVVLSP